MRRHIAVLTLVAAGCGAGAAPRPEQRTTPTVDPHVAELEAKVAQLERDLVSSNVDQQDIRAHVRDLYVERASRSRPARRVVEAAVRGSGRCGGDLPPCWVMMRESGGNIRAQNPRSSASGKWLIIDSTWAGYGGYAHAKDAPEDVQDAKARRLWAGGAGCRHWQACA